MIGEETDNSRLLTDPSHHEILASELPVARVRRFSQEEFGLRIQPHGGRAAMSFRAPDGQVTISMVADAYRPGAPKRLPLRTAIARARHPVPAGTRSIIELRATRHIDD